MSKKNRTPETPIDETVKETVKQPKKKKKKGGGFLGRLIRRFFLVVFTVVILAAAALVLVLNLAFNGPSPAMQEVITMSLIEASATKWVPALFIGEERVAEIRTSVNQELPQEVSNSTKVVIQKANALTGNTDEWANYPDGIRIERVAGDTYNAHVMIVRNPETVYMGTSTEKYSTAIPGKRITEMMEATPDAIAAVNAGAFFDDGTTSSTVGSYPLGLVVSNGRTAWESGKQPGLEGFAGFNNENILVVSQKNLSKKEAEALNIRDGCCFGPVLLMDGEVNLEAYNNNSGFNPRTAIGQRADGAVNACNMDGGSSSVMMYRDERGLFGEAGATTMINNYSLLQSQPRRMPNFWMVRKATK